MDVEVVVVALEGGAIEIRDAADGIADGARGAIHGVDACQSPALLEVVLHQRDSGLGEREAAAGQEHEGALARDDEGVHLAADVDLVIARVGAGVGGHDETLPGHDAETIGHGLHSLPGGREMLPQG